MVFWYLVDENEIRAFSTDKGSSVLRHVPSETTFRLHGIEGRDIILECPLAFYHVLCNDDKSVPPIVDCPKPVSTLIGCLVS